MRVRFDRRCCGWRVERVDRLASEFRLLVAGWKRRSGFRLHVSCEAEQVLVEGLEGLPETERERVVEDLDRLYGAVMGLARPAAYSGESSER